MPNDQQNSYTPTPPKPPKIPFDSRTIIQHVLLIVLVCLVIFVFDYHCPFKAISSIPCPGCGMTRACIALMQGHVALSLKWHALLIPTLIFLGFYIGLWFMNKDALKVWEKRIILAWAVMMILYWIWRIIFVFPNSPLF